MTAKFAPTCGSPAPWDFPGIRRSRNITKFAARTCAPPLPARKQRKLRGNRGCSGTKSGGLRDLGGLGQHAAPVGHLHARDDEALHLGRALEDLVDLRVAEPLLQRV